MKVEQTAAYHAAEARYQAKLASITGYHVNLGFLQGYYACVKAVHNHDPKRHMTIPQLRAYARYARLAMAVNTVMARDDSPQTRIERMKYHAQRAWEKYRDLTASELAA